MPFRAASLFLLLVGLAGVSEKVSGQEVYRCIGADGTIMFTDDRDNFPSGCREAPFPESRDRLTLIRPAANPDMAIPALLKERSARAAVREDRVLEWKRSAYRLATGYREAKAERVPTLPPAQVHNALERMQDIRKRKRLLLQKIANAPVSPADRREIEKLLETIPSR